MCVNERRRLFLRRSAIGGLLSLASGGWTYTHIDKLTAICDHLENSKRWSTLSELLLQTAADKADRKTSYLSGTDMSFWHAQIHPVLKNIVPRLLPSGSGAVVELGSYKGESADVLEKALGLPVVRLDIHSYYQHDNLVIGDIRTRPLKDRPARLVWNDVSSWTSSPRSRMAAFEYGKRNLIRGGIYIDDRFGDIPKDLDLSGFELIHAQPYISVFRRV